MENKIKKGLLIFILAILLLPVIQQYVHFITSKELSGYTPNVPDLDFSCSKWWSGAYQNQKLKYINDDFGFRPDFVRINNQVDYSLFKKLHSWKVVEGSNNTLFMDTYIDDYFGRTYIGYEAILKKMMMIRALSDTLARLGKSLILVHSPAKEFMYPEYIPDVFKTPRRSTTNLETFLRVGDSLKINQVDFNTWFCSMKNDKKELLYAKQGVHWTVYGSFLAADSLIKYIEKLRNIKMPHPVWTKIRHTDKAESTDDDIAKTLNLIYPITHETFSYPEVSYTEDHAMVKPKVIYVGDSFLLTWIADGILDHTTTDWQVWLWFAQLYNNKGADGKQFVINTDWVSSINNSDCVVIMNTSINLPIVGNGFVEQAYEHYFPK